VAFDEVALLGAQRALEEVRDDLDEFTAGDVA
jgi:hypothetical protein